MSQDVMNAETEVQFKERKVNKEVNREKKNNGHYTKMQKRVADGCQNRRAREWGQPSGDENYGKGNGG